MPPSIPDPAAQQHLTQLLVQFAQATAADLTVQAILELLVTQAASLLPSSDAAVTVTLPGAEAHSATATSPAAPQDLQPQHLQQRLGNPIPAESPAAPAAPAEPAEPVAPLPPRRDPAADTADIEPATGAPARRRRTLEFPVRLQQNQLGTLLLLHDAKSGPLPAEVVTGGQALADVAAAYLLNAHSRAALRDAADRALSRSLHDDLTGLPNRTLMLGLLEHAELRRRRTGKPFAVFYLDLDGFKPVNDTHGHDAGDELLIAVAHRLTTLVRPPDTVARLHGDEFAIICEDLDDPADAITRIAARLHTAISQPFTLNTATVRVTTSIGITITNDDHPTSAQQILRDADTAMYTAKHRGGNHQHLFNNREHHNTTPNATSPTPAPRWNATWKDNSDDHLRDQADGSGL